MKSAKELQKRIDKALEMLSHGAYDGSHHKDWAIDQALRSLTGCPMEKQTAIDSNGNTYEYETQGKSEEYNEWVRNYCDGEEGPATYSWSYGIAP